LLAKEGFAGPRQRIILNHSFAQLQRSGPKAAHNDLSYS
jgi:hypothetical protein